MAASRLGMNAKLLAAVGDDDYGFGARVSSYLESSAVNTSLVRHVKNERTPVTGVITVGTGRSLALGWKNEARVQVSARDVETSPDIATAVASSDFLFLTFEPPIDAVEAVIRMALGTTRSSHFVTPSLRQSCFRLHPRSGAIDYLVTNPWELGEFSRRSARRSSSVGERR